jgi:hypothetical protein
MPRDDHECCRDLERLKAEARLAAQAYNDLRDAFDTVTASNEVGSRELHAARERIDVLADLLELVQEYGEQGGDDWDQLIRRIKRTLSPTPAASESEESK